MNGATRIRRHARAAEYVLDEPPRTVVARVPDGAAIVLQGAGELIWMRVPGATETPRPAESVAAELAAEFATAADERDGSPDRDEIVGDVLRFLSELEAHGLVDATSDDDG